MSIEKIFERAYHSAAADQDRKNEQRISNIGRAESDTRGRPVSDSIDDWFSNAYSQARADTARGQKITQQRRAERIRSYNSLVADYQALFDENKKLRTDRSDSQTVSKLLERANELYKKRNSDTESGLKAMQESLRSILSRNMMQSVVSGMIPDSVERAIEHAEKRAGKMQAAGAAIAETVVEQPEMTVEEAANRYKEISRRLTELNRSGRTYGVMESGGVYTPEAEKEIKALRDEQDQLSQYIRQMSMESAMQHDSSYWARKASHEEERLMEANTYRSGYGGAMQSGVVLDAGKKQRAEDIQREYDQAREYYYYTKNAEDWNRMTPELQEKAMEAARLDVSGVFDWNKNYYYEEYAEAAAKEWNGTTQVPDSEDTDGSVDWKKAEALSRSGLTPDQRADESREDRERLAKIRQEITAAGFDADRIIEYANRLRNQQKMQEETQSMAAFGTGSVAGGIAATAATYGANLLSGIGSVGLLAQRVFGSGKGITEYRPVDYNVPSTAFSQVTQQTRQAIGGQMGETGQFFYNALNSAVDSAARMLVGQAIGNGFLPEAVSQEAIDRMNRIVSGAVSAQMNAQVFTDAFISAKQSGATDDDAILDAIVQAAIEGITEKYSVEAILKNPKQLTWMALRNSFMAEGSEEIASDVLNTMYDELKNGSDSELRSEAKAYIDAGIGAAEAWKRVLGSYAKQIILDGLAGGLSGLAMGAASELSRSQEYKQYYRDAESGQALVDEALELNPENETAIAARDRLQEGKPISGLQAAELTAQNNDIMTERDKNLIQKAAANRLSELGEGENAEKIGAAISKKYAGETLSEAEQNVIEQSRYGQRVINELDPENIRSGGYASEWAEKIGTDRINQYEYGRGVEEQQEAEEALQEQEPVRSAAGQKMTVKTGKAGTSVRGTDVVKAVKIGDNDIVIQKTDGSTASINTVDQRGTALEVLQFAKEMPDFRDTMTVNGMMRDYEAYLGSARGNRGTAERFCDNYVIAVYGGAEGESLADVLGVTTEKRMQTAMEHGWRRGVEIAKGRRASMEMGSAGKAAMEQYGYLYPGMFSEFYRAGQQGASFQQAMEAAGVKSLGEIKKTEMKAAWKAGRKDGTDYEVERYAVSDAGSQRENGLGSGGKAGNLEEGTGGSKGREGGRVGRRGGGNAEDRTSLKELGVRSGTDAPQEVVSREKNEYGGEIITVSERLMVRGQDGTEREVQAIQSENNVILRADDPMMEQHKAHELEHIRQRSMTDEEITAVFREKTKSLSDKNLRRILSAYALDYYGLYGADDTTMADLYREYLADEAAGIRQKETDQDVLLPGEQTGMTDRRGEAYAMRGNQTAEYNKPITAQDVAVLRSIGRKGIHAFTSEDIGKAQKWAYKFYQDLGVKSPFFRAWFGDWRANQTKDFVTIAQIPRYVGTNEARKEQRGIVKNRDTGWDIRISREGETNTISHAGQKRLSEYGLAGIRSLIENAYLFDTEVHEHHSNNAKNDLIAFDHKLYSLGRDTGGNIALYKITVEESYHDAKNTNERRFHNLKYVEKVATVGGRTAGQSLHGVSTNDDIATNFSVADLYDLVKRFDREFSVGRSANRMMLNEDGTPKLFYHGAKKNGGFMVFRDWQYFTEKKSYAERYAERGNQDAMYAVYLSAEKIFDTRDAKAARIFREIRQEYGLGELQDTGLPDWTDGYDITDYLEEHPEFGYDAILLDEGGDLVNGKPVSRGFSIVIKNSAQIKSATNNIGTFDRGQKDIRYSTYEPQSSAEYAKMQRERKRQEALMEQSTRQTFELRRQFTEGTERNISANDLPGIAADLRRIYGKKSMGQTELQERLEHIATVKAREQSPMEAYRRAKDEADILAADMIRNALGQTEEAADDWNGIKAAFRSGGKPVKLFIDGANRMDLEDEGGYEGMRKRLMGYAFLSSGGVPVDVFYQEELSSRFPGYFPESIQNPADQLIRIVNVIDKFRSIFRSPYAGSMAEDTEMLSQDILQRLYNGLQPSGSEADFAEQHEDMVRAYYETKLQSTRDAWKNQVEQMKQGFAEKQQEQRTAREERKLQEQLLHIAQRLDRVRVGSEWKSKAEELVGALDTAARSLTGKTIIGDYIGNVSSEGIETVGTNEKGQKVVTLDALREFVSRQQAENPDFLPDQKTMDRIKRLDKVQISDLTIGEIRNLLNAMQNLENEMRVSKKLIDAADRRDVAIQAEEVRADIAASQGVSPTGVKRAWSKRITTQGLSPVRFLRRITGYKDNDPLYRAGQALQDGETAMLDYQRRAEERFRSFREDKAFMESLSGKKSKPVEITGRTKDGIQTVKITPDMRIAIYLHSKNSENVRHAERGGMVVPNYGLLMKGKTEEAYEQKTILYLTRSQMQAVGNGMTAMERNYANAIWEYFNTFSKDEINQVSRSLLGYDIAVVRNYYPIEVNRKFTRAEPEAVKHDAKIESSGFTKSRTGAGNPINLRGATETLGRAINQHSKYVGLAIPIRNFGKLYGNTSWSISPDPDDLREIQTVTSSVRDVLDRKWGSEAGDYIEKLLADIQNPANTKGNIGKDFAKIRSNYAGAVLTLNLSVAMKQAASYPTAAAVVGWKALGKAMPYLAPGVKVDLDTVAKYTPLLWYRSKGYSTKELGDLAKGNKSLPKALNWIQAIDVKTTSALWKAAEFYIRDNQKGLTIGSEDYYKAVAEVYNRIILETQPNYTTMERPNLLRENDTLLQNIAMFKTQPLQNLNIAYDAIANLRAKERQLKAARDAAKNDPAAAEQVKAAERAVKEAKRSVAHGVSALLVSSAVFSAMTLLWNLFRGKMDKYKDDDEVNAASFIKGFGGDMLASFAGMVPFAGNLYDLVWSVITGETYYGIDVVSVKAISDFLDRAKEIPENVEDTFKAIRGDKTALDVVWSVDQLAVAASKLLGIPVENVQNLMKAVSLNVLKTAMPAEEADYWYRYYTTKTSASKRRSKDYDDIYAAAKGGNTDGYQEMRGKMEGWIWKENDDYQNGKIGREEARERATETVNNAMKDRIREEFLGGTMQEAEAKKLLPEIAGFDKNDKKKLDETVLHWACERDTGIKYDDLRDAYLGGEISGKKTAQYLAKYGWHEEGMTEDEITEEAEATVRKWEYQNRSGDSDAGVKQADQYYELAEPAGISMDVYNEFYNWQSKQNSDKDEDGKDIKGKTKKDKVLAYIDSMDLSRDQKDALFLTLYKESGLKDTPWH